MTSVPAVCVRIEGHADIEPIFNANYYSNADLSADRAETLSKKLQWRGIAAERIEVVAHAADRPADDNATALGRRNNRRAEVRLLWPEGQTLHYGSGSDKLSDAAQLLSWLLPCCRRPLYASSSRGTPIRSRRPRARLSTTEPSPWRGLRAWPMP